jgi:hypothetical protein
MTWNQICAVCIFEKVIILYDQNLNVMFTLDTLILISVIIKKKILFYWQSRVTNIYGAHIMLRDLLTQKYSPKNWFLIFDTQEHVHSENINLKIGNGSSLYQLFSKRDFSS